LRLLRFLLLERLRDFFGERLRLLFLRDLRGGMMWVLVNRKIFLPCVKVNSIIFILR
jgi:hypothetical protein